MNTPVPLIRHGMQSSLLRDTFHPAEQCATVLSRSGVTCLELFPLVPGAGQGMQFSCVVVCSYIHPIPSMGLVYLPTFS